MPSVVQRELEQEIRAQIDKFPIIGLTGPRQSGKTTLLKDIFIDYEYISLENPDLRAFAEQDPNQFLDRYDKYVILDEAQRVPKLFSYLQTRVDNSRIMGQYILSGSQNFHLMQSITQSLAGRIALFKLFPFSFGELQKHKLMDTSVYETIIKGFYPAIYDRDIKPKTYYSNYIESYIERDISQLINIQDMHTFRLFVKLCAHNAGQLLNLNSISKSVGISQPTARAWLSLLESSYVIFLLQPNYENFKKRLVKTPKLYFYDSGLLCNLLGIHKAENLEINRLKGSIFENLMVSEFVKVNYHYQLQNEFYFWRDSNGHEVDLMRKTPDGYDLFEMKSTKTINTSLFKELDYFESIATNLKINKTLIYTGSENQKRSKYFISAWDKAPEILKQK